MTITYYPAIRNAYIGMLSVNTNKLNYIIMDKNKIQFFVGLILALGSAAWTFFGSFHPSHTVVLIVGIALIATSKYRLLK